MLSKFSDKPRVALVAMPWYSVWVPSVQLAVLRRCLDGVAHVDSYELYVDYAANISTQVYDPLSGAGEFAEEWLFARHYFPHEGYAFTTDAHQLNFPPCGLGSPDKEKRILAAVSEVTGDYLLRMRDSYDWGAYDIIGFTLGIAQTASSMALARLIRLRHPSVQIVFGGSACTGPAAEALLKMCPYADVIVRGEAEGVVGDLVTRMASGQSLEQLAGVTYRGQGGTIRSTPSSGKLYDFKGRLPAPDFDEYIARMERNGLRDNTKIMLPFESSRGCWWGEKSQCTFCGLAETMQYRKRPWEESLEEIDRLYDRYGIGQFFATDLIMPQEYYETLLPQVKNSDRDYRFYYELKGNVNRWQMSMLADLVHVQPGLESLSSRVLKLMKKGISATQNIQFLKWCVEFGVNIFSWHLIVGVPGEEPDDNEEAARNIPSLWHLPPPHFAVFELHRFSPIHRNPGRFGLSNLRPAKLYHDIFPVEQAILDDLVYRFEYDSDDFGGTPPWMIADEQDEYACSLRQAVDCWKAAHDRGASLTIEELPDGSSEICDARYPGSPKLLRLSYAETILYQFLDTSRKLEDLSTSFHSKHFAEWKDIGGREGITRRAKRWLEQRLLLREAGRVVALAVGAPQSRRWQVHELPVIQAEQADS